MATTNNFPKIYILFSQELFMEMQWWYGTIRLRRREKFLIPVFVDHNYYNFIKDMEMALFLDLTLSLPLVTGDPWNLSACYEISVILRSFYLFCELPQIY